MSQHKWTAVLWPTAYVVAIYLSNLLFSLIPPVILPSGEFWSPAALLVGFVFVFRDLAQRQIGHCVWIAMLMGAGLSYVMADPFVAIASLAAFLIAETVDWLVYSASRRSLRDRILLSSALSTPIDTIVFLSLIGQMSATGAIVMVASKMTGALVVFLLLSARATRAGV